MKCLKRNSEHRQAEETPIQRIRTRIEHHQCQVDMLVEQLVIHASLQAYTEQEYAEQAILLKECLAFLETLSPLPLELGERRNELLGKLRKIL